MNDTNDTVLIVTPAGTTAPVDYYDFVASLIKKFDDRRLEICHAAMGVSGEAGELCDALKRDAIYGKDPDIVNIIEELGDLEFFMQDIRAKYNIDRQQVLQANADKLSERYVGLVYTDTAAIARADKLTETPAFDPHKYSDWRVTNTKYVYYSPLCDVYVFSDEASQLDTTPHLTEEAAKTALEVYALGLHSNNWGLTKEQQGSN